MDLKGLLKYVDGELYWRASGEIATYLSRHGTYYVRFPNQSTRPAHAIIWELHDNEYARFLEHLDGDLLNNRIENLCPKGAGAKPTKEFLNRRFYYDGYTLRFKSTDKIVGAVSREGYLRFSMSGRIFGIHQLVWLYHFGEIPAILDHINGDKLDNRLENLRSVTVEENRWNMTGRNPNKPKGVYLTKDKLHYQVRITHKGKCKSYGQFDTEVEAAKVAAEIYKELHGEFNRE